MMWQSSPNTGQWTSAGKNCIWPAQIEISVFWWADEIFQQIKQSPRFNWNTCIQSPIYKFDNKYIFEYVFS